MQHAPFIVEEKRGKRLSTTGVGINSVNGQLQEYSLLPNPSNGKFEIMQSVPVDEVISIAVYNVMGQRVYAISTRISKGSLKVDTQDALLPGFIIFPRKMQQAMHGICDWYGNKRPRLQARVRHAQRGSAAYTSQGRGIYAQMEGLQPGFRMRIRLSRNKN